jgi:hypothetical protein
MVYRTAATAGSERLFAKRKGHIFASRAAKMLFQHAPDKLSGAHPEPPRSFGELLLESGRE